MYSLLKQTVEQGGFKLKEVQHKIKKLYLLGDLTENQADELLAMTIGGISTDAERPETLAMLVALSKKVDALELRVKTLEQNETGNGDTDGQPTIEEWKPWDGLSDKYQNGAIVTHNGITYKSVFVGQNVWEPATAGTESLWVIYSEE